MVQVKKPGTREAILNAAHDLFAEKGYLGTTLTEIAKEAGVTTSNIYNYFPSKLDVFYEIYTPWYAEHLEQLDEAIEEIQEPREKLKKVLWTIFQDIPLSDNCFSNNLIQAVSTRPSDKTYSKNMLYASEKRLSVILRKILPDSCEWLLQDDAFANFLLMAFDGFAMHVRVRGPERRTDAIVEGLCTLLLGPAEHARGEDDRRPWRLASGGES